jgi:hypothetical protein
MQLACRHPAMTPEMRVKLRGLVNQLAPAFDGFPALAETVRRGWDVTRDR